MNKLTSKEINNKFHLNYTMMHGSTKLKKITSLLLTFFSI